MVRHDVVAGAGFARRNQASTAAPQDLYRQAASRPKPGFPPSCPPATVRRRARVAELADAQVLGTCGRKPFRVQVPALAHCAVGARHGIDDAFRYAARPPNQDDMTHVIAQPCIGVKDKACVDVCPVDCIHGGDADPQLYINPNDCIDCTLCVDACPVQAIFAEEDLPAEWKNFTQVNRDHYKK
jgi:ferredoxin